MNNEDNTCCLCLNVSNLPIIDLFSKSINPVEENLTYFDKISKSFSQFEDVLNELGCVKYTVCHKCCSTIDKIFKYHEMYLKNMRIYSSKVGSFKSKAEGCNSTGGSNVLTSEVIFIKNEQFLDDVAIKNSDNKNAGQNENNMKLFEHQNSEDNQCCQEKTQTKRKDSYEYEYICDACGNSFNSKSRLDGHHILIPLVCEICEKKSSNYHKDISDKKSNNCSEQTHVCDQCGKSFQKESTLLRHKRFHSGESTHNCDICEQAFKSKYGLAEHNRLHTGEKPFMCDICGKGFTQSHLLTQHKLVHTGERPYACDMCDKTFQYRTALAHHKQVHTGEKPYACDLCQAAFPVLAYLKKHKRCHSNEKPCKCTTCGKTFRKNYALQQHIRIHTGQKPYECEVCKKRFYSTPNLKSHRRTHTGEKPYSCQVCSKTFAHKSSLDSHRRTHQH